MTAPYLKTNQFFTAGARTLPGRYYCSAAVYAAEIERIFCGQWLYIGRAAQIANPGEYFLRQIGPESLIIVRGQDRQVRAFYNVCRHRGTRLCEQAGGKFPHSIQCPYHAWTYALNGALIGAPLMDDAPGFERAEHSLHCAALAEWEGFLFANLAAEPQPFESAFAPLIGKFADWQLPALKSAGRIEYDVKANWKLIVQNYSECYHCPLVHPDLARKTPYQSGRNDLYEGPFLGGFMDLNHEYGSLTVSGQVCAAPIGTLGDSDLKRVYYYSIFPNMLLSLHPDYVMCHMLWPQAAGETHILCEWFFAPDAAAHPDFNPQDAVDFWDMTNRQDWHVCELSQLGVASRAYRPSPYSPTESLLAAFDRQYLHTLGEP